MESKKKRLSQNTHIAVDIKRKRILSLDVTSEQVHDSQVLPVLIDRGYNNKAEQSS